jgi:predicted RNA-binding Zn ribbon-like protein
VHLDSYADHGVLAAVELVNALTSSDADEKHAKAAIKEILTVDPAWAAKLRERDVPGFLALAHALRPVFEDLDDRDVDAAASRLNALLAKHSAHPHLAKEDGRWRLHHHPEDVQLVPMYTAICAEALARMIGADLAERFGVCSAPGCDRVYFDVSRNASRRFCSTTCQNRVKAGTFRSRRASGRRRSPKR